MNKTKLINAKFTFTEDDDFPIFNGWYDPENRYWNGWANPYFTKTTRDSFIALQKSMLDETYKGEPYEEQDQEFMDELLSIEPQEINGKELYYFGSSICWDEVKVDLDFFYKKNEEGFEFNDVWITDPTKSECGRFEVDPKEYYGIDK